MADEIGQFETEDNAGSTQVFTGTATTTPSNVPAVAGNAISGVGIVARRGNLEVSFDGGLTFWPFEQTRESLTWDVKGRITQLVVRTSSGSVDYRIIINFEDSAL